MVQPLRRNMSPTVTTMTCTKSTHTRITFSLSYTNKSTSSKIHTCTFFWRHTTSHQPRTLLTLGRQPSTSWRLGNDLMPSILVFFLLDYQSVIQLLVYLLDVSSRLIDDSVGAGTELVGQYSGWMHRFSLFHDQGLSMCANADKTGRISALIRPSHSLMDDRRSQPRSIPRYPKMTTDNTTKLSCLKFWMDQIGFKLIYEAANDSILWPSGTDQSWRWFCKIIEDKIWFYVQRKRSSQIEACKNLCKKLVSNYF